MTDSTAALSPADQRAFRDTLGHYASGITIVTGISDEAPTGFTCQSFYSVSMEPPLVSFSVMNSSTTYPSIRGAGRFVVNVLSANQAGVSSQFARKGTDKFAGVDWAPSPAGDPILSGGVMWFECELWAEHVAGDHTIVIGRVTAMGQPSIDAAPLLFFKGAYRHLIEVAA